MLGPWKQVYRRAGLRTYAAALSLLAIAFLATRFAPWTTEVGDVQLYKHYAMHVRDGMLPYRDVPFEYPPLAAALLALAGVAGNGMYVPIFVLLMAGFAAALVLFTGRLARVTGGSEALAAVGVAATPLLLGTIVRGFFDLAPTALTTAAILAIGSGATTAGFAVLALAVMTKGYPLVVIPIAVWWLAAHRQAGAALKGMIALALTMGAVGAGALALSPHGAWASVRYQTDRPIEIESSPASVLLIEESAGAAHPKRVHNHRSIGLRDEAAGGVAALFIAMLVLAIVLLSKAAGRPKEQLPGGDAATATEQLRGPPSVAALAFASLGAIAAFAALGKVLSPQYLVWTAPLLGLALAHRVWGLAALVAAAMVLTQVDRNALGLRLEGDGAIALVALRNVVLIAVVVFAGLAAQQSRRRGRASVSPSRSA